MKGGPVRNEISFPVDRKTRGQRNKLYDTTRKPARKPKRWDAFCRITGWFLPWVGAMKKKKKKDHTRLKTLTGHKAARSDMRSKTEC